MGHPFGGGEEATQRGCMASMHDHSHIAMTYTALAVLSILGDDLSRVRRGPILRALGRLQQEDGRFTASFGGSECDMRFLFCAAAISFILGDWSAVDKDLAVSFVESCQVRKHTSKHKHTNTNTNTHRAHWRY